MNMTPQEYDQLVKKASPKSPFTKNFLMAFIIGGSICALGQVMMLIYQNIGVPKDVAPGWVSITLVFLAVTLTGLDVYNSIAKVAGAGTLVPITGFANAMASAAIEFKSEGWILGLGAKIFIIAGPVIAYGVTASVIYGIIYYLYILLL